jgi:hypothetical protein
MIDTTEETREATHFSYAWVLAYWLDISLAVMAALSKPEIDRIVRLEAEASNQMDTAELPIRTRYSTYSLPTLGEYGFSYANTPLRKQRMTASNRKDRK